MRVAHEPTRSCETAGRPHGRCRELALGSAVTAEQKATIWVLGIFNVLLVLAVVGIVIADGSIAYWEIPGFLLLPVGTAVYVHQARTNQPGR